MTKALKSFQKNVGSTNADGEDRIIAKENGTVRIWVKVKANKYLAFHLQRKQVVEFIARDTCNVERVLMVSVTFFKKLSTECKR